LAEEEFAVGVVKKHEVVVDQGVRRHSRWGLEGFLATLRVGMSAGGVVVAVSLG
jgi:hypothetical protein